jgi:hypothetical protein
MTKTIEKITVKQASQAINQLATNFMESNEIDADLLSILTKAITNKNYLQLRDYMLGMPSDFGVQFMINFAEAIVEKTETENSYAIKTILSAYYFENLESGKAKKLVDEVLETQPNYALAKLLSRVFGSGWSAESFVEMRNELHPKVIVAIKEQAEVELSK